MKKCLRESSAHGVKYVASDLPWQERLLWGILFLVALGLASIMIQKYPTVLSDNKITYI